MQNSGTVIATLNALLAGELTAIHQYIVHAEMTENWGYAPLHDAVLKRAKTEMKHTAMLLSRILTLGGSPVVTQLNAICIGPDVTKQFQFDRSAEMATIRDYNAALQSCHCSDPACPTCAMLRAILKDENEHLKWLDAQLALVAMLGAAGYLATQGS